MVRRASYPAKQVLLSYTPPAGQGMWNHGTGGYASPETGSCSGFFRRAEILYPANLNSRWRGDSSWYCHHNPDERNPAWYLKQGSQGNDRSLAFLFLQCFTRHLAGLSISAWSISRFQMRSKNTPTLTVWIRKHMNPFFFRKKSRRRERHPDALQCWNLPLLC